MPTNINPQLRHTSKEKFGQPIKPQHNGTLTKKQRAQSLSDKARYNRLKPIPFMFASGANIPYKPASILSTRSIKARKPSKYATKEQ